VTPKMKAEGWKRVGDTWHAPAAPRSVVQESRAKTLEDIAACYRLLGLSLAESRVAACIEVRSINDGNLFDCKEKL
jgi:hypothetical protein